MERREQCWNFGNNINWQKVLDHYGRYWDRWSIVTYWTACWIQLQGITWCSKEILLILQLTQAEIRQVTLLLDLLHTQIGGIKVLAIHCASSIQQSIWIPCQFYSCVGGVGVVTMMSWGVICKVGTLRRRGNTIIP